jgi:ribosomal subunit interface protein
MQVSPIISFHNMEPSEEAREHISDRVDKLERYSDRIIACRVAVRVPFRTQNEENEMYNVRISLTVPGEEIVVSRGGNVKTAHESIYQAVEDAFDTLEERLKKEMEKRRPKGKVRVEPEHGVVLRVFKEDGYGFILSQDGSEVYFHQNSLPYDPFEDLEPGDEVRFAGEQGINGPQASTVHKKGKEGKHIYPPWTDQAS